MSHELHYERCVRKLKSNKRDRPLTVSLGWSIMSPKVSEAIEDSGNGPDLMLNSSQRIESISCA